MGSCRLKINTCKSVIKDAQDELGVSSVSLSVTTFKGMPFLVDGDGKIIHGIGSVSISGGIGEFTRASVEFVVK